jgi:signal transduction histidine kinase
MNSPSLPAAGPLARLAAGLRASWLTILLIAAINTGFAAVLWSDDPRPFWHPLVTVQLYGFSIAYFVNLVRPWDRPRPIPWLAVAVAAGTLVGVILVVVVKGYSWEYVTDKANVFGWNIVSAFFNGLFVSLFFFVKFREARATTALHKAEAERHLLAKQAIESELKLMQAQVEPHFLFNTLSSVQYLTETDPPAASRMLTHLIAYLRAALPQLRAASTTLGQELVLVEAYLNVLKDRIGERLTIRTDVDPEVRAHPFPPNMLITLVENAIKHGIEPSADGGTVTVAAHRDGERLVVSVTDTGRGLGPDAATAGGGVGLANVRERLAALHGPRASFTLQSLPAQGTTATLAVPWAPGD